MSTTQITETPRRQPISAKRQAVVDRAVLREALLAKRPPAVGPDIDKDGGLKTHVLQEMIRNYDGTIRTFITPRVARLLLEYNTHNRKIVEKRVDRFRNIIRDGRWDRTGNALSIDCKGRITNGQHRLCGIVSAGVGVEWDICFNLSDKAFVNTDTDAPRTAADVVSIEGYESPTQLAATIRLLSAYVRGNVEGAWNRRLGHDEILEGLETWPDLPSALAFRKTHGRSGSLNNAHTHVFTFLALRKNNEAIVAEFLSLLSSGANLQTTSPIYRLRERLAVSTRTNNRGHDVATRLAWLIKAWNLFLRGDKCRSLIWRKGFEKFPTMDVGDISNPPNA